MYQGKIAVRYAKSLLMVAKEKQTADNIYQDMKQLLAIEKESKDFRHFLETPLLKGSEKTKIIDKLLEGKIDKLTHHFLHMVIKKRRELFLGNIARSYIDQYRQNKGIKPASLITATEVNKTIIDNISKLIGKDLNTEVELEQKIDEKIVGGYILRIEDKQFDNSVAAKLKNYKHLLQQKIDINSNH